MIEGTGPGRGVPWWRSGRLLTHRWAEGLLGAEPVSRARPREGRTVARIGR